MYLNESFNRWKTIVDFECELKSFLSVHGCVKTFHPQFTQSLQVPWLQSDEWGAEDSGYHQIKTMDCTLPPTTFWQASGGLFQFGNFLPPPPPTHPPGYSGNGACTPLLFLQLKIPTVSWCMVCFSNRFPDLSEFSCLFTHVWVQSMYLRAWLVFNNSTLYRMREVLSKVLFHGWCSLLSLVKCSSSSRQLILSLKTTKIVKDIRLLCTTSTKPDLKITKKLEELPSASFGKHG